jgi:hypothetical protein
VTFIAAAYINQEQDGAGRRQQNRTNAAESAHARPYCVRKRLRKSKSGSDADKN